MAEKKPKLTVKEQKLVKGVAAGKSQTQAAKDAGYSPRSAHEIASKTLKKVDVQQALQTALEKHGITLDKAVEPISRALNSEDNIELQLKGSDRALKLMGVGNGDGTTVNVNFNQIVQEQKEKYGI